MTNNLDILCKLNPPGSSSLAYVLIQVFKVPLEAFLRPLRNFNQTLVLDKLVATVHV